MARLTEGETTMTTDGIEAVFLETRNWGKAAKFFQALGYQIEFETRSQLGTTPEHERPSSVHRRSARRPPARGSNCLRCP
jgi:hypothetical protein